MKEVVSLFAELLESIFYYRKLIYTPVTKEISIEYLSNMKEPLCRRNNWNVNKLSAFLHVLKMWSVVYRIETKKMIKINVWYSKHGWYASENEIVNSEPENGLKVFLPLKWLMLFSVHSSWDTKLMNWFYLEVEVVHQNGMKIARIPLR